MPNAPEEISLLESLDREWIKLPLAVMRDVGPAAKTLGAILRLTSSETYVPVADIADRPDCPFLRFGSMSRFYAMGVG